jgi:hypothetical protein
LNTCRIKNAACLGSMPSTLAMFEPFAGHIFSLLTRHRGRGANRNCLTRRAALLEL